MLIQRFAPAKVNLMLHVVDRLVNGYHHLQTLMTFVDVGDFLTIEEKESADELILTGEFAHSLQGDSSNSVIQAKEWFYQQFNQPVRFFKIQLEKNLPVAAGIGGGTSDAAAMLAALLAWHQIDLSQAQKHELVRASGILGADIPVCLAFQLGLGSFFWLDGSGIGELPCSIHVADSLSFVLINPGIAVNTGMIFQNFHSSSQFFTPVLSQPAIFSMEGLIEFMRCTRNDLEVPARCVYSDIPDISKVITKLGAETAIVRQSGSGSTYFVLTEATQAAQTLAKKLKDDHPNWWIKAAKTIG